MSGLKTTNTILIDGPGLRKCLSNEDRKLEIELKGSTLEQVENIKLLGLELMNNSVSMFISTLYVRRFQSVSAYLTELRLTYQEQSVYFIIIL